MKGTVESGIIFRIGQKGVDSVAGKMGKLGKSLTAGGIAAGLLAKAIGKAVEHLEEFDQIASNVPISLEKFNHQTIGLVDTMTAMRGAAEFSAAKINITEKQFAAMGAAAVAAGQKLGEGGEGITARFKKLQQAVIQCRERALLEVGIELDNTSDKAKGQQEALNKLVEKYGDFQTTLKNTSEKIYAFNNNIGTISDYIGVRLVKDLKTSAGEFAIWMGEVTNSFDNGRAFIDGFGQALDGVLGEMMRGPDMNLIKGWWNEAKIIILGGLRELVVAQAKVGNVLAITDKDKEDVIEKLKFAKSIQQDINSLKTKQQSDLERARIKAQIRMTKRETARINRGKQINKIGGGQSRVGGGQSRVGGTEAEKNVMDFTEDEYWKGRALAPPAQESASKSEIYQKMLQNQRQYNQQSAGLEAERQQTIISLKRREMEAEKMSYEEKKSIAQTYSQTVVSGLNGIAAAQDTSTRKGFMAQKAFSISAAVVQSGAAAISAVRNAMEYPGPAAIPALAANLTLVATQLGIQLAAISSRKFSTSTSGGPKGGSSPAGGSLGKSVGGGNQTIIIQNIVEGQKIHQATLRANKDASQRGEEHFTVSAA